jgi:hypothetical protein
LSDISVERVNTGSAGTVGGAAVLALIGALLAGGSVNKVTVAASAGKSNFVKVGSNHTGGTLNGISSYANRTEGSRTSIALECFSGIKIVATGAGASTIVWIVNKSLFRIAVDADWRIVLNVKSCKGGT